VSRPFSAFRANARDHRAGILVAALSSAFGVALVGGVNVLGAYIGRSRMGEHGSVQVALAVVAGVFFVVAVYVGAIVTTGMMKPRAVVRSGGSSAAIAHLLRVVGHGNGASQWVNTTRRWLFTGRSEYFGGQPWSVGRAGSKHVPRNHALPESNGKPATSPVRTVRSPGGAVDGTGTTDRVHVGDRDRHNRESCRK